MEEGNSHEGKDLKSGRNVPLIGSLAGRATLTEGNVLSWGREVHGGAAGRGGRAGAVRLVQRPLPARVRGTVRLAVAEGALVDVVTRVTALPVGTEH